MSRMSAGSVRPPTPRPATRQVPPSGCRACDLGAECAHGGGGAQHVLAFQQAGDAGLADRQGAEHQRAMADGFVARDRDAAGERRRGPTGEQLLGCVHPGPISMEGVNLTALVAGPAGAILLPAPPGSGKSTLTAALVAAGLDYFSDEVALLCEDDLAVTPFPLAMCVKDTGIDALAALFPELATLPVHTRMDGKRVVYMPPPAARVPAPNSRRPVIAIVFPRYVAGAPNTLRALPKPAALARLISQCMGVQRRLEARHVTQMISWIRDLSCYELDFSDLGAAVSTLVKIANGGNLSSSSGGVGA